MAWRTFSQRVPVFVFRTIRKNSLPHCTSRLDGYRWSFNGSKKNLDVPIEERRRWIEPCTELSIRRQCELAGVSRSGTYYEPVGESELNLELMRMIDEQYMITPFYGSRKMMVYLNGKRKRHPINRKRVQRLMRLMGIAAIYRKPRLSQKNDEHKVYPYLLRDVAIVHPDQVWSTDITYIPMAHGFLYLVAIIDWFSRYVLAWRLSNTLDPLFCIEALDEALSGSRKPEIFNSDQGSQFTSKAFTDRLKADNITISMDGRGRCFDNIFIERLWRSVKYEEVYLHAYENGIEAHSRLGWYFPFYNTERIHQSLNYRTPSEVYFEEK
jgi:putative transposase